jgi:hypothetical protein
VRHHSEVTARRLRRACTDDQAEVQSGPFPPLCQLSEAMRSDLPFRQGGIQWIQDTSRLLGWREDRRAQALCQGGANGSPVEIAGPIGRGLAPTKLAPF